MLDVPRGAALYVGALVGPGLLLVPALAANAAGPASIVAWAALLVLSAPLAVTFAALGVRRPVAGGVSAYVDEAFGKTAAAVTGAWFLAAGIFGGPAVALIGGYYVADLTGSGTSVAVAVAVAMYVAVFAANAAGLRLSSGFQLFLSAVLVGVVALAVAVAVPGRASEHWTPFAPHGWWAVGTAANVLMWLFIGWEAMAQLAGEFRDPRRQLPRAMALAFAVIAVLYASLAVATIVIGSGRSRVPLADLIAVGFGHAGRDATAVLAVTLTMGTMNVYTGSVAKLAAALARDGTLPAWLGGDAQRSIPRRPLLALFAVALVFLVALGMGVSGTSDLIRASAACFIAVYVFSLASALRLLDGLLRVAAAISLLSISVVGVFSSTYLSVPAVTALLVLGIRRAGAPSPKSVRTTVTRA
ncbi:MAG TPA: amino acid permease [Gaiellaceae bacterium]|nr:amino acid permease [Gaiellaceae bacterium]